MRYRSSDLWEAQSVARLRGGFRSLTPPPRSETRRGFQTDKVVSGKNLARHPDHFYRYMQMISTGTNRFFCAWQTYTNYVSMPDGNGGPSVRGRRRPERVSPSAACRAFFGREDDGTTSRIFETIRRDRRAVPIVAPR